MLSIIFLAVAILGGINAVPAPDQTQSLTREAGYHVIYSYSSTTIPSSIVSAAKNGSLGGLILFGANVNSQTASQITSLQSAYAGSGAYAGSPLLITTDQEGGEVNRLPGGPALSAKQIGQSSNPATTAASAGTNVASVFKSYNVNVDLAPVLGVFRSPGDFLDEFQRSYGNTSSIVSQCVGPFITNMQAGGKVAATAKHFPGLGAAEASQNTDERPVTLGLSLQTLHNVDEVPYTTAIQAGVKLVMPSWALYPALDNQYPSGLSKKWIQQELRTRLGFKGVTISDAITAGALQDFGSIEQRAVLAVQAGMDMIVVTGNQPSDGVSVVKALADAVRSGKIDSNAWAESNQRILQLRSELA